MRLNADFNVSLSGLEAELTKALKPLENLLRTATGNKNSKVVFSEAGSEFFGQGMQALNQRYNLGLSPQEVKAYQDLFARASAAKEAMTDAIKDGNSGKAVAYMVEMSQAVQELFDALSRVTQQVQLIHKDLTSGAKSLQATVSQVAQARKKVRELTGQTAKDVVRDLDALEQVLDQLDAKTVSKDLGRPVDLERARMALRNFKALGVEVGPRGGTRVDLPNLQKLMQLLGSTFKDLDELEHALNLRAADDLQALQQVQAQLQAAQLGHLTGIASDAGRSRGLKNALGTGRANAEANRQARAFSLLYGRSPRSPEDDELFQQFIETLGPTVDEFQGQLYNIFSNTIGSLGAAAVFLTASAIAKTSDDLAGLTQNLQVYQNILESHGEEAKAQDIAHLRKELTALAGVSEQTVTKLSSALVEIARLGGSTEGFASLVNQARVAYRQYGVDVNGLLEQAQGVLLSQRRNSIDPGMLAEVAALAGPQAGKALENFDKLASSQAGLTLSYEQLRDAALAYAKSGHEVSDSLAQVLEYSEKGAALYPRLAEEAEKAGKKMVKSVLFVQGEEVFKAQQQVGAAISETLLSTFDSAGLGQGSKSLLTLQTALLGLLTVVERFMGYGGQLLDWLNTLGVAGVRAGDLLRIAGAVVALTTALKALSFVGKLVGGQLLDTAEAWKRLGEQSRAKKVLGEALDEAVKKVGTLRGGLAGLGPLLSMLGGLVRGAFGPLGLVAVGLTALGAWAFQSSQARKAEAAALNERTGQNLVTDDRGNSRFRRTGESLTYALGDREIDVTKALADLKNLDLAAAKIGISNADIEGAQDLRDLYQVVKRYQETRANFEKQQTEDLEGLRKRLAAAQSALADVTKKLKQAGKTDPNLEEQRKLQAKIEAGTATPGEVARLGELRASRRTAVKDDSARLLALQSTYRRQVEALTKEIQRIAQNSEADEHMTQLVEAFKDVAPILESIKNYDDALATVQLYQEYGLKKLKAEVDYTRLDRFAQQEQEAQALISALEKGLQAERNPTRRQTFSEAIAEAQDRLLDARLSRIKEQFALDSDDINTLPNGYTRYNESLRNLRAYIDSLQGQMTEGRKAGATAEKLRSLENDIQRAQNDLVQANNALSGYRAQLERSRDQAVLGVENAIRPVTEFIADTGSFTYKLVTQVEDVLKQYQNATADEFASVAPSVLRRFDLLFSQALDADLDRRMVDDYIRRAKAKKDEYQRVNDLLSTFSANRDKLKDKGAGLAYLVEESSKLFFGDGGIVTGLEAMLEQAESAFNALEGVLKPPAGSEADTLSEQSQSGLRKVEELVRLLKRFDAETPAIKAAFVQSRTRQLDDLYKSIEYAQGQVERYQKELAELSKDRVKNAASIETTRALLKQSEERLNALVAKRPEFEKLLRLAGEDAVKFVQQTKEGIEHQANLLVEQQLELLSRFREFLARQTQTTQRLFDTAFDGLRKYQQSVAADNPSLESMFKDVEDQAKHLEEDFKAKAKANNDAAYQAQTQLDRLMAEVDREYRAILDALRASRDPKVQAEKRSFLQARLQRRLAELRARNAAGVAADDEKRLLASLETNLALLEFYLRQRDLYRQLETQVASEASKEKVAVRVTYYKNNSEKALQQAEDVLRRLDEHPVGRLEDDLKLLAEVSQQYGQALNAADGWIGRFAADGEAAKLGAQDLSTLQSRLNADSRSLQERTRTFLSARLEAYLKDLSEAANTQTDAALSEAERELARRKGFSALADLQLLRSRLGQFGLDTRDEEDFHSRIRQTVLASAELFRGLLDFQGFDLSDGEFLQDLEPLRQRLAEYGVGGPLAQAVLQALFGPEAVQAVEAMLEALDNSSDEQILQNGMVPTRTRLLGIRNLISALGAAGLDPTGEVGKALSRRADALDRRLDALGKSQAYRELVQRVEGMGKEAEGLEAEGKLVEALRKRLTILETLDAAMAQSTDSTEDIQALKAGELERLKGLVSSAKFIPQALGKGLLELWDGVEGSPQERAQTLAAKAIEAVPELARLPEDLKRTLLQFALKPVLEGVSEAARKEAERALKEYALKKASFQADLVLDPASALQGLAQVVEAYQKAAFQQVQAAKTAFENAETEEERAEAGVQLKGAVLDYIQSYKAFLEDLAEGIQAAYDSGKLSDAEYEQALKDLESLSVNPVLLLNQLRPLASAIGMGEEELKKLVQGFLDLSKKLKQMREQLDQTKLRILGDASLTRSEREYALKAAEVQSKLDEDTQGSKGDLERAQALRDLVFDYIERQVRKFEEGLDPNLSDELRSSLVVNYRNSLVANLSGLDPQHLYAELGLNTSSQQVQQYLPILLAALKDSQQETKRGTDLLSRTLFTLLNQLQGMLQSFFMEVMNIPARLAEEARARAQRAGELQSELVLVEAQIAEYEKLYQEAVKNYGAASEEAERYRQKLAELRGEQRGLSEEFRRNEKDAKGFFDYLLEAIANFLKAFANAVQQLIAQELALRAVKWVLGMVFPEVGGGEGGAASSHSSGGSSEGGGSGGHSQASGLVQNTHSATMKSSSPDLGGTAVQAGVTGLSQWAGAGLSSALGLAGTAGAFLGPLAVGVALGFIATGISNLVQEYSDKEQDHRQAGVNRFDDARFDVSARRRVEIHLHGQYDRKKLAQEAGMAAYDALGKELLD